MRILIILIPGNDVPEQEPALRLARVIEPYYLFLDGGVDVVLASPAGGSPWTRREANGHGLPAPVADRFRADREAHDAFADTLALAQVFVDDIQGAFCVGEMTSIWPSQSTDPAAALVAEVLAAGKPVAIIPDTVDIAPAGASNGLLILGRATDSPLLAARALLQLVQTP
jgi:putative intracellular protease/amidase